MASSNRVQVASVVEVTLGTTPNTPRMRLRPISGESLNYRPTFVDPSEMRSDRMTSDTIPTGTQSDGGITYELNYPVQDTPKDVDIQSAFYSPWSNVNVRDNDGAADSVITNVATAGTVLTVTTGTAFVASELYRFTGFGVAGNNGVFKCTTGSATVPAFVGSGITDEAVPPAAARVKCVGLVGASGDITATASGLASTTLDFTTIPGLAAGKWIKVGGTAAGDKFATAALNTRIRITAVAAHAITCDNLPSGWTTDAGTGKTLKVWFGDQIKNGTTQIGQTFERGYLAQTVPTYIVQKGMVASQYQLDLTAKQVIKVAVTFMGMSGSESTTSLDASPDAIPALATYPVFAASANVGRVGEAGATLASPNFVGALQVSINNNITPIDAIDSVGPAGLTGHECTVTGTLDTYFGDDTLLAKFYAGTPTSVNCAVTKGVQLVILSLPRILYNGGGTPNASAKNTDVKASFQFRASKDETTTNALILMDRFEYFEA